MSIYEMVCGAIKRVAEFYIIPKFSKKPNYDSPTNKYQEFSNAYVYSIIVKTGNGTPNYADVCREATQ
ncbi:5462_t:CDS:2 [Entrophospora sp. SA101]|nr:5462_t:CDS:2 [Entrophospora sp. SA101]CAJ0927666.1 14927_t:CDS:2 [Entrophospora sp. SA101]